MLHHLYHFAAIINQDKAGIPSGDSFKLVDILNAVYFWAGAIAVIVVIVAGFLYVTAANNSSQVTRAKNAVLSAVIGLVIILLAYTITNIAIKAV